MLIRLQLIQFMLCSFRRNNNNAASRRAYGSSRNTNYSRSQGPYEVESRRRASSHQRQQLYVPEQLTINQFGPPNYNGRKLTFTLSLNTNMPPRHVYHSYTFSIVRGFRNQSGYMEYTNCATNNRSSMVESPERFSIWTNCCLNIGEYVSVIATKKNDSSKKTQAAAYIFQGNNVFIHV
ncbi:hypothetical protein NUSPORA_01957 [Nucleospora cyclopteri]